MLPQEKASLGPVKILLVINCILLLFLLTQFRCLFTEKIPLAEIFWPPSLPLIQIVVLILVSVVSIYRFVFSQKKKYPVPECLLLANCVWPFFIPFITLPIVMVAAAFICRKHQKLLFENKYDKALEKTLIVVSPVMFLTAYPFILAMIFDNVFGSTIIKLPSNNIGAESGFEIKNKLAYLFLFMGIPVLNFITTYFIIKSKFSLRQSFLIFINAILPLSVFGFMHVFLITTGLSGEYVGFFFDPPMFVSVCISVVSWGAFFMDYWALCKKSA